MNDFLNALFIFINNPEVHDLNYQIALGLLENGHELDYLTISELAEKCYVSTSSLNRFFRIFGYKKYMIFKALFASHMRVRFVQIQNRITEKKPEQLNKILSASLKEDDYQTIMKRDWVEKACKIIHDSKRIVVIGSDEMFGHFSRVQVDFYVMGKLMVKDSIYQTNFIKPHKDDCVILLSMAGRIVDLNPWLIDQLKENTSQMITLGHHAYVEEALPLRIPDYLDEVLENMLLDYYMQEITYYYVENYL